MVGKFTRVMLCVIASACSEPSQVGPTDGAGGDSGPGTTACEAPDVLVVLDRTASMAERPDGTMPPDTAAGRAQSKWFIAVDAVESLVARLDSTIRFGLALFPRAPVGSACVTVSERIAGKRATNPQCEAGELLVEPALDADAAVASGLDPEATRLCTSTPIGAGLATARSELAAIRGPRPQYVLFVGDGADTCNAALALTSTDELARDGVHTFVVAFDAFGGIDHGLLNDMACAGRTAPAFPAGCAADAAGSYRAVDRVGPAMYLSASNGGGLVAAFEQIAGEVCCGCVL
jgi:hypothetical protein